MELVNFEQVKRSIEEGTKHCLKKLKQDPSDYECHSALTIILNENLSAPTNYSEKEQNELLNCLKFSILPLNEEEEKIKLLKQISWDVFTLMMPFLSLSDSTSNIAQEIVQSIAQHNNARETHMMIMERFSWLEWKSQHCSTMEFSNLIKVLRIVLNRLDRKILIKFLPETVQAVIRVWSALDELDDVHRDIVTDSLIQFAEIIAELMEVEKKELKLDPTRKDLDNQEYYLSSYLIITSFEKFIRSTHIPMSPAYYEIYHPKFHILWERKQSAGVRTIDKARLMRLIQASIKAHISIDQLVNYINSLIKEPTVKDSIFSTKDFPISPSGVIIYVASVIYYQFMHQDDSSVEKAVIPLSPGWLFKNIVSIASKCLSSDAKELEMADKTLLVLLYLTERNEENTISSDHLEAKLSNDGTTITHLYQFISVFASTSPDETLRFISFKLLSRLITLCKDDARIFLLRELLTNCPFETMKSAAIEIVKENVAQGLDKAYESKSNDKSTISVFASRFIIETFFPHILRFESPSILENEKEFSEKYSFIMQGLNFYLFLLMRDKENLTGVWNNKQIIETNKEYIEPIKKQCDILAIEFGKKLEKLNKNVQETSHTGHNHNDILSNFSEKVQPNTVEFNLLLDETNLNNIQFTPSQELAV
ncbi:12739_t:CDS:10 [Funneliformis caledonium]|uniref:12739_t:CDS:1 n=1 Tax=Funneliformis caledonium TaxID=1117310 RepID=A0A9N9B536_9GLOM|nr:12739_t:CDS:10 [Funneliformis caledonium]